HVFGVLRAVLLDEPAVAAAEYLLKFRLYFWEDFFDPVDGLKRLVPILDVGQLLCVAGVYLQSTAVSCRCGVLATGADSPLGGRITCDVYHYHWHAHTGGKHHWLGHICQA